MLNFALEMRTQSVLKNDDCELLQVESLVTYNLQIVML